MADHHTASMALLTDRQQEVYEFIRDKIRSRGYGPTVREIGGEFGIASPNGVMCHLRALERKGLVELPVAEGYGLIVGRLRPGGAVDIEDYLGPGLADELAMLDFASWEPHGEQHVHKVGASWKDWRHNLQYVDYAVVAVVVVGIAYLVIRRRGARRADARAA